MKIKHFAKRLFIVFLATLMLMTSSTSLFITANAQSGTGEIQELDGVTVFNKSTGQCINYDNGKVANGTYVRTWSYDGEGQIYDIYKVKDGVYRLLLNANNNYALDIYCPNRKLKAGLSADIWKTESSEAFAQNLIIEHSGEGDYYYLKMASNKNLCLTSSGKNARVKLQKFTGKDTQKWYFKDSQGKNNIDITSKSQSNIVIPSEYYTLTGLKGRVNGVTYLQAQLTKELSGIVKGSLFYIKEPDKTLVTDKEVFNKLAAISEAKSLQTYSAYTQIGESAKRIEGFYLKLQSMDKIADIAGDLSGIALKVGINLTSGDGAINGVAKAVASETIDVVKEKVSEEIVTYIANVNKLIALKKAMTVAFYTDICTKTSDDISYILNKPVITYEDAVNVCEYLNSNYAAYDALVSITYDDLQSQASSSVWNEFQKAVNIVGASVTKGIVDAVLPDDFPVIFKSGLDIMEQEKAVAEYLSKLGEDYYTQFYNNRKIINNGTIIEAYRSDNQHNYDFNKFIESAQKCVSLTFVNSLSSKYNTNITTQKWAAYYKGHGYHLGVDLGTSGNKSTNVNSIADGEIYRILKTKNSGGWGNLVIVKHTMPDGKVFYSGYGHLKSFGSISEGQEIKAGTKLGVMGNTGNSTGPHLHLLVFTGILGENSVPAGYSSKKITGDSYKYGGLTYYNPLKVISTNGAIIK